EGDGIESIERGAVAEGDRDKDGGWRLGIGQSANELAFAARIDGDVEQQERGRREWRDAVACAQGFRRGAEERRAIGGAGGGELLLVPVEQHGEVGAAERQYRVAIPFDQREPELLEAAREAAWEARPPRDGRGVPQRGLPL